MEGFFSIEFKSFNSPTQRFRYPNDVTEFNVPNGFLHRETNTRITSNLDVLKLLATHGTVGTDGNRSIVFHDCHHWTRLVPRFQLVALIWVLWNLFIEPHDSSFMSRLLEFACFYVFSYLPEMISYANERERQRKVKKSIRSFGVTDEKRLAELCEIHDYNQFKIMKELFKD